MTELTTTPQPAIDVSEDIRFVDTDCHIYDAPDLWVKYIDRPFLDRVPHWIEEDGRLLVNMGGNVFPSITGHFGLGKLYGEDSTVDRSCNDPHLRLHHMDATQTGTQVIFPTLGLCGIPGMMPDPALAEAYAHAYNRFMIDHVSADPKRLRGAMLAPFNHPSGAIKEMQWARAHGLNIVVTNPTPPNDTAWSSPANDPIWSAAQDLGICVVFHEVTVGCPPYAVGAHRFAGQLPLFYLTTHVIEALLAMSDVVAGGVCERFPRLRFGVAEAHVAWLTGILQTLDDAFRLTASHARQPGIRDRLSMAPSDYVRRQFFFAALTNDAMIAEAAHVVGHTAITISTDWPHPLMDGQLTLQEFYAAKSVPDRLKNAIMRENARVFLDLDLV
jgi:uncharacterized protein